MRDRNHRRVLLVAAVVAIAAATTFVLWLTDSRRGGVDRPEVHVADEHAAPSGAPVAPSDIAEPTRGLESARESAAQVSADAAPHDAPTAPIASPHAYMRVVACNDGRPVVAAVVQLCKEFEMSFAEIAQPVDDVVREGKTDTDGRFDFEVPGARPLHVRVRAFGFGPVLAEIDREHATLAEPQTVCVERSAVLNVEVVNSAGAPVRGVQVGVTWDGADVQQPARSNNLTIDGLFGGSADVQRQVTTDGRGRGQLAELPPNVPLNANVTFDLDADQVEGRLVVLEPGESRDLRWVLGVGCRLEGQVIDQHGKPVAMMEVVLQRPSGESPRVVTGPVRTRIHATRSDEDGRFVLEDVGPGSWWVSPVSTSIKVDTAAASAVAGLPVAVHFEPEASSQQVTLRVHRGLFIEGHVLEPDGEVATAAVVRADEESSSCKADIGVRSDGSFRVGPVIAGRYVLRATSSSGHADSEASSVTAGDTGVELRLRAGGELKGTVVDEKTDLPCIARVFVRRRDQPADPESIFGTEGGGKFVISGLEPGRYDLRAQTHDDRFGEVRGVRVESGSETHSVTIRTAPGGELHLRCDAPNPGGAFEIVLHDLVLERGELRPGITRACTVPSGRVSVRFTARDEAAAHEQTVEVPPNGRRVVVFKKDL